MNHDTQLLQGICQYAQLDQNGIRAAIKSTRDPAIRQALSSQLREYEAIHCQARQLLKDRGLRAKKIPGMLLALSRMEAGKKLRQGSACVAERMIEHNRQSMARMIRQKHGKQALDPKVSTLSNRLMQTQQANIAQLQPFL